MAGNRKQFTFPKRTKGITISALILLVIVAIAITAYQFLTDYIWMDSLSFGIVYTKILYTKIIIAVSGFVLFFIFTFITMYFIRFSYMNHFSHVQLPPVVKQKKYIYPLMLFVSLIIGLIGSGIIQG